MSIDIVHLYKHFGNFTALHDINLKVNPGELVALIGPSGSGKTTLLRLIAGLEVPSSGMVMIDDEDSTYRDARQRRVGFVFQHYALFKHMSVFNNIAFGLQVRPRKNRPSKSEIQERVMNLLKMVQLEGLAHRYPAQLSGGQRQRIALARALAVEPSVLLLDEPFGALDAKVRKDLRRWLRRLHDEVKITSIFVTHDQEEALEVADRVVIMHQSKIEQVGSPEEVYDHPATPFVYDFLGDVNLFHGRIQEGKAVLEGMTLEIPNNAIQEAKNAVAYVRPHEMEITREKTDENALSATVESIIAVGPRVRIELKRHDTGAFIEVEMNKNEFSKDLFQKGEKVFVKPRSVKVFLEGMG
ncbi:MAG: sulfate/molybdate ABC transporter ATP-binding protein [Deltaproteobacteria bacterium]|nr:sulfate/molybdate ABC transporter ATP-binding protein [Deltaproteobacteria bacterium]